MGASENATRIRAGYASFNSGDVDGLIDLFDEDSEWRDWADAMLTRCASRGAFVINPLVFAAVFVPLSLISPEFLPRIYITSDKASILLLGIAAGLMAIVGAGAASPPAQPSARPLRRPTTAPPSADIIRIRRATDLTTRAETRPQRDASRSAISPIMSSRSICAWTVPVSWPGSASSPARSSSASL